MDRRKPKPKPMHELSPEDQISRHVRSGNMTDAIEKFEHLLSLKVPPDMTSMATIREVVTSGLERHKKSLVRCQFRLLPCSLLCLVFQRKRRDDTDVAQGVLLAGLGGLENIRHNSC